MQAAHVIHQWRRHPAGGSEGPGFGKGVAHQREERIVEQDWHAAAVGRVKDGGGGDARAVLAEEQGVGGELRGVVLLGQKRAVVGAQGGAFFVIHEFEAVGAALDDVDHADEAERDAFDLEAAHAGAFGQAGAEGLGFLLVEARGLVGLAVGGGAGGGVGVFLKEVFDPLEVEETRAIEVVVQPPHRHQRERIAVGRERVGGGGRRHGRDGIRWDKPREPSRPICRVWPARGGLSFRASASPAGKSARLKYRRSVTLPLCRQSPAE